MAVTPSGQVSEMIDAMRTLIASSAAFQTWTGAANAAAAKEFIHPIGLFDADGDFTRPYAWISVPVGTSFFGPFLSGMVLVGFEDAVDEDNRDSPADAFYAFWNHVAVVIGEVQDASEAGGALVLQRADNWRLTTPTGRTKPERNVQFWQASFEVDFGLRGG